jgi:hypothetical protein
MHLEHWKESYKTGQQNITKSSCILGRSSSIVSYVILKIMKNLIFWKYHWDNSNDISYANIYLYILVIKYVQNRL